MDYGRETSTRGCTSYTDLAKSTVEARKIIIMMLSVNSLGTNHSSTSYNHIQLHNIAKAPLAAHMHVLHTLHMQMPHTIPAKCQQLY